MKTDSSGLLVPGRTAAEKSPTAAFASVPKESVLSSCARPEFFEVKLLFNRHQRRDGVCVYVFRSSRESRLQLRFRLQQLWHMTCGAYAPFAGSTSSLFRPAFKQDPPRNSDSSAGRKPLLPPSTHLLNAGPEELTSSQPFN